MVLRRGGRKQWKKRRGVRKGVKRAGMRRKYADAHSFKLQSLNSVITNTVVSGIGQPQATGSVFIDNATSLGNRWSFGGSFRFMANQAMQINQLNTFFDRYKINGIKVTVIPQNNFSNVNGGGVLPVIRMCYDYDDNTAPSVGDVWSRRGVERLLDKPFSVYLKPKILHQVYSPTGNASQPRPAGYIDMAKLDVPHYGLKFAVKDWFATSTPNDHNLRFEITYYVTVKEQIQIAAPYSQEENVIEGDGLVEEDVACENKPPPA